MKYFCIVLICAICILMAVVYFFFPLYFEPNKLILSPAEVKIDRLITSGDSISIPLIIDNPFSESFTIHRFQSSCGCQKILTHDEIEFSVPYIVKPKERVVLQLIIDTSERIGDDYFSVLFEYESQEYTKNIVTSQVYCRFRPSIIIQPQTLFVIGINEDILEKEFTIWDGSIDNATLVEKVVSSAPDKINIELTYLDDGELCELLPDLFVKKRYILKMHLKDCLKGINETITVVPRQANISPIHIPIIVQEKNKNAGKLFPSKLLIYNNRLSFPFSREIRFAPEKAIPFIKVLEAPEIFDIECVRQDNETWLIIVEFRSLVEKGEIVLGNEQNEEIIRIPFRLIQQADNN